MRGLHIAGGGETEERQDLALHLPCADGREWILTSPGRQIRVEVARWVFFFYHNNRPTQTTEKRHMPWNAGFLTNYSNVQL